MKKLLFLFLSFGILFTGCDNDALVPDATNDADLKSGHVKMVPIKGVAQSHVDVYDNGIPIMGTLSGKMSHLGKLNKEESVWVTSSLSIDEINWIINWEMTGVICAANGDLLNYTLSGNFVIAENKLTGHVEVEGGTGRFEFAEGNFTITGYADNPAAITTMFMEAEGMLSNVGSSKK